MIYKTLIDAISFCVDWFFNCSLEQKGYKSKIIFEWPGTSTINVFFEMVTQL